MAHLYRIIAIFCFLYPSITCATLGGGVGEINLAGWIKGADGTYSKAFTNLDGTSSKVNLTSAPKGITTTSTALVQSSKGAVGMDIAKTANVVTSRLGPVMVGLAKKAGPLGMTLTAAALVCELTSICNNAGQWMMKSPGLPPGDSQWTCYGSTILSLTTCRNDPVIGYGCGSGNVTCDSDKLLSTGTEYTFKRYVAGNPAGTITLTRNSPITVTDTYQPLGSSDFDNAAPKLNDDRVTPHLIEAGEPVPTDSVPTLSPGQKKDLGLESEPTKDSSGNITGRKDTTTSLEPVDAGTSDEPGKVIIKETKTTVVYDNSNTQISSTTNTSYSSQPDNKQPSGFTISFDTVPESKLDTYNVPNTFGSTSWGSGSCPPNIDVPISKMTIHIPTQPVCDTALMIQPFVLLLSSLIGIYIIAGVRGGSTT